MKRKALGKGLRSLIREAPAPAVQPQDPEQPAERPASAQAPEPPRPSEVAGGSAHGPGLRQLDTDKIQPNRSQPRRQFDDTTLRELADSMKSQGILQPVVVRPVGDGNFELIAGERRWRAAQLAGLLRVPAVVREVEDRHMLELALIENLQRENLNPIDEAEGYQTLIHDLDMTQEEVASSVGKHRSSVANVLRLLNLPPETQERIRTGSVSTGHAKALASLANSQAQNEMAERIAKEGLSVRQVESLVASMLRTKRAQAKSPQTRDPNVEAAETELQRALATKVRIVQSGKKGAGRLELHFYGDEELQRLYRMIHRAAATG